jgi:hypothetical protein
VRAIEVILIGAVMLAGVIWTYFLFKKGDHARVVPTLVVGAIVLLGVAVRDGIALADPKTNVHFLDFCSAVGKAALFAMGINFKSLLAPLVIALTISVGAYYLFEYRELHPLPVLSTLVDLVFSTAPRWLEWTYCIAMGLYCSWGSLHGHVGA